MLSFGVLKDEVEPTETPGRLCGHKSAAKVIVSSANLIGLVGGCRSDISASAGFRPETVQQRGLRADCGGLFVLSGNLGVVVLVGSSFCGGGGGSNMGCSELLLVGRETCLVGGPSVFEGLHENGVPLDDHGKLSKASVGVFLGMEGHVAELLLLARQGDDSVCVLHRSVVGEGLEKLKVCN